MEKTYYPNADTVIDLRDRLPKKDLDKLKVLNVGAGSGGSGLARQLPYLEFGRLDHVDVHQPYLEIAKSVSWNTQKVGFINSDIRGFDTSPYDLVLMFDVLEHLPKEDALKVMDNIKCKQIIFIPLEKEFRANVYGAKSQDHLSFWTEQDFKDRGYETQVLTNFHKEDNRIFDALWAIK